jgi:hypothetical protein
MLGYRPQHGSVDDWGVRKMSNQDREPILSPDDSFNKDFEDGGFLKLITGIFKALFNAGGWAFVIAVIVLMVGIGVVCNLTGSVFGSIFGINLSLNPQTTARVHTSDTVVHSIRPLGQLVSISAQLAKADVHVRIRQGFGNVCGFDASHVAVGTIEAGIDLTQLSPDDVNYDAGSDTFTITLPSPQLTSCRVDSIRQYDRSYTTCRVDWDEARRLAQHLSIIEFRDDAMEGGILDRAHGQAHVVLSNFLQLSTGRQVNILFREADTLVIPRSCEPQVPAGWEFDEEDRRWEKTE